MTTVRRESERVSDGICKMGLRIADFPSRYEEPQLVVDNGAGGCVGSTWRL